MIALLRTHPRRYGSTFTVYLEAARHYWGEQPIYDLTTIGQYLYWPSSLVLLRPVLGVEPVVAAAIVMTVSAVVLSWASIAFMRALCPPSQNANAVVFAGILLLINIPAAWFNFKYVQAQIMMTGGMMLAAAAMMRERWYLGSIWLLVSAVAKPLALVMILLCLVVRPRMRLALLAVIVAALLLPFAFVEPGYLAGQYRAWIQKLMLLSLAQPPNWPYQADFMTMLDTFGVALSPFGALALRIAAALGTLAVAWRIAVTSNAKAVTLAVLLLSACYITLFGPRNEFLSFLVLTLPLTGLALMLIARNADNYRGWLLIAVALVVGAHWNLAFDRVVKPALVCAIDGWMIWLTIAPHRWHVLIEGDNAPSHPTASPMAAPGTGGAQYRS